MFKQVADRGIADRFLPKVVSSFATFQHMHLRGPTIFDSFSLELLHESFATESDAGSGDDLECFGTDVPRAVLYLFKY